MKERAAHLETQAAAAPTTSLAGPSDDTLGHSALAQRRTGPRSREEAEERYVAARDAWTAALRAANSGHPADLASLALAQEAYEAAAAERERWISGGRVAIPIESETRHGLEAVVGHELEWRRIHSHHEPSGLLGRLKRRITGR